jgi:hypothetical protein
MKILHFLSWLIEQLLWELLHPVWLRWREATGSAKGCYELRWLRLVGGCDCYPCLVTWSDNSPLYITSRPDDMDYEWIDNLGNGTPEA